MARSPLQQQILIGGGLILATTLLLYYYTRSRQPEAANSTSSSSSRSVDNTDKSNNSARSRPPTDSATTTTTTSSAGSSSRAAPPTSPPPPTSSSVSVDDKTPVVKNASTIKDDEKALHLQIEELDKKGKALFKDKKYLEAAQAFTEALDIINSHETKQGENATSSSLIRQAVTLMNNRSAMYEKGDMPELALEDCNAILEQEMTHTKARTRKLRILEGMKRWREALVEMCAIQLVYMQTNRASLRMGLPVPPPPVPVSKMEEILAAILPEEVEEQKKKKKPDSQTRALPSDFTILQLLRSYSGYNAWMGLAAKDGSVTKLTTELDSIPQSPSSSSSSSSSSPSELAKRATLLMKRGRRRVYDRQYEPASKDFEQAYHLVESNAPAQEAMEGDSYARLLEWTGMVRHWHYELDSAMTCYAKCADLEPTNTLILVKQAGVQMDATNHVEALRYFDMALGIDPSDVDALLHRSNLRMLQGKTEEARHDLENCIKLRPHHVLARLRLASILAALGDFNGAKREVDLAEEVEPKSSEVQSYRGELFFTQGDMEEARKQFEKAIKLEPLNPTPYVNAAMALLNTPPPPGQIPDAPQVMRLLERALEVDPQFTAAYIQLGQLKLGTATDLTTARQVIELYDEGLKHCRSPDEIKELCSMRLLAVAQVEAAASLRMETFNVQ